MRTHEAETIEKSVTLENDGPFIGARVMIESAPEAATDEIRKKFAAFWKDAIETIKKSLKDNTIKDEQLIVIPYDEKITISKAEKTIELTHEDAKILSNILIHQIQS